MRFEFKWTGAGGDGGGGGGGGSATSRRALVAPQTPTIAFIHNNGYNNNNYNPTDHPQQRHAHFRGGGQQGTRTTTTPLPPSESESRLVSRTRYQLTGSTKTRNSSNLDLVKNWFVENLRNYCSTTSLHGFTYMTRKGMTRREHFFWICIVILCIVTSIVLVVVSWLWSRETPTVTVIESSHFPLVNVPFPAVTICNFNKISKRRATDLAQQLKRPGNMTEAALLRLFYITMYFSFAANHSEANLNAFDEILTVNNMTLREITERLQPNCMDMISKCIWKGSNTRCDSLFQTVNTAEGACCSFNYFGTKTNNFPRKIAYQLRQQPFRITGCGYPTGLSVLLNPHRDDYYGTYFSSYGFRLLIHDAYNFPSENAEAKIITASRESFVRISPESSYATEDIKNMNIPTRNCLFGNEGNLTILQRYSFANCISECRGILLHERCGCVPTNLPNNGSFPICELRHINCLMQNREIFTRALPNLDTTISVVRNTENFPCNCLPNCEMNEYPSEITMGRLNVKLAIYNGNNDTNATMNDEDNILLHVFFSDLMSTRYRKEIFQNWLSALASFGGLLGLIMGFSIVSAFEFFYFLTFRPIFNYCHD